MLCTHVLKPLSVNSIIRFYEGIAFSITSLGIQTDWGALCILIKIENVNT